MSQHTPTYNANEAAGWQPRPGTLLRPDDPNYDRPTKDDLREVMKAAGLTGGQTAKIIGVDARTIRKWTGGERNFPWSAWAALLTKLGMLKLQLPERPSSLIYWRRSKTLGVRLTVFQRVEYDAGVDFQVTGNPHLAHPDPESTPVWMVAQWRFHDGDKVTILEHPLGKNDEAEVVVHDYERAKLLKQETGVAGQSRQVAD